MSSQDRIAFGRDYASTIPSVEDDIVVIYAVEGLDANGVLRRLEESTWVDPLK